VANQAKQKIQQNHRPNQDEESVPDLQGQRREFEQAVSAPAQSPNQPNTDRHHENREKIMDQPGTRRELDCF